MLIAFLGNDGSGKTTISKEVYRLFKELGFETIYKHKYEYFSLPLLLRIIGKEEVDRSRDEMLLQRKDLSNIFYGQF
jgi:thymidylate kinase